MLDILGVSRPEEMEGRPLRAILGDRLDQAAAELEGEAVADPLVVARLQDRLGQTYLGLGHAAKAEALFTKAVTTRQAHLGADDPLTLHSRHNQALAFESAGKRIEAIERFEQVRSARVRVLGVDHVDTLSTLHELGTMFLLAGKYAEAIKLLEQVRDGRVKQLGEDHDHTLATLKVLAGAYRTAGKPMDVIALTEKVRDALVKKHGDDHPLAISAMHNLAQAYKAGYKMTLGRDLLEQARNKAESKLGPNHPLTLKILYSLGTTYLAYRKTPEAIAMLEHVRERQVMILGGHHPSTLLTLDSLGMAYQNDGKLDKALPLFQQAAAGVEKLNFADESTCAIIKKLCRCLEQLEQYEQAEGWWRKLLAVAKEEYSGPVSRVHGRDEALAGLGSNLIRQTKYIDAEPILRECLAILQKKQPEDWETFHIQSLLGGALSAQQKYAEAEPQLVQAYQGMKKADKGQGARHVRSTPRQNLGEALERLVQLYDGCGKHAEAAKWRKELEAHTKAADKTAKPEQN